MRVCKALLADALWIAVCFLPGRAVTAEPDKVVVASQTLARPRTGSWGTAVNMFARSCAELVVSIGRRSYGHR